MIRRNVNLTFIDRSEVCYMFRFICIQHACCSGTITSKWARPMTRSASPKSCTPSLCHEFLELRSCRCINIRDVQTYKGHRIVTASLIKADLFWRYIKTPVLRNLWHWMDENVAPLTSGIRWIAHRVGPGFDTDIFRILVYHVWGKLEQNKKCTYSITLRRVCVTFFVVEKQ